MQRRTFLQSIAAAGVGVALPARAQRPAGIMQPVLTRGNNNSRTGCNSNERILNQGNVGNLHYYFDLPMEGDARGAESQILVIPNIRCDDGATRDLAVVSCMNGLVYAFDANYSDIEWVRKASLPVLGTRQIDGWMVNNWWSFLATGVIDPDTNYWYDLAWSDPNGNFKTAVWQMHCFDCRNGSRIGHPVNVTGTSKGQNFLSMMRKQRSSMTLATIEGRKTIFFGCGTISESSVGAAGYVFAYDIATATFSSCLAMTSGDGAGIWMAGGGLVCDGTYLYALTGNGGFDGVNDWGESFVKMSYHNQTLAVVAGWAPYTDTQREGKPLMMALQHRAKLAGINATTDDDNLPVNVAHMMQMKKMGEPHQMKLDQANYGGWYDEDLGSAGLTLVGNFLIGCGKDGIAYVLDVRNFPSTALADLNNPAANYAKLASPPLWATYFPGYNFNPAPQDATQLDFLGGGFTRHNHSTPVSFVSSVNGTTVFFWGENSPLRAWKLTDQGQLIYLAQSVETASANATNGPGGMPGGFMSITYAPDIANSAILWACIPYGNANTGDNGTGFTAGRFLAYDAEHFTNGAIKLLWDSQAKNVPYKFNKFCPPTITGGKAFLPTYGDTSKVFGV